MDQIGNVRAGGEGELISWLLQKGLEGASQDALLEGYCQHLTGLGVPLMRVQVAQSGFHPRFGGVGFIWRRGGQVEVTRYAPISEAPPEWLRSPFHHLLANGLSEFHQPLNDQAGERFPLLAQLREEGATDYLAVGVALAELKPDDVINPTLAPEGVLISFAADAGGITETDLRVIRASLPYLGLALKSASNRKMAQELLGVYLGRDAGDRVLSGEIERGSLQKIQAAICYFDLSGFTSLTERIPGEDLIAMLNAYFGLAVEVVRDGGGHVLKFMGDGMMAMFNEPDMAGACAAALDAASVLRKRLDHMNVGRQAENLPCTGCTLALHSGEILYGNIGADDRLDFTVIGPAVNLTARLSGLHRSVGQNIIVSEDVVRHAGPGAHDLVSLGRYMVRGVAEPKELFTIYEPA